MSDETEIRPFRVDVPDEAIADLRRRIAAARWPSHELVADRSQGVQLTTIRELASYWTTEYDWRACEMRLNALPQFTTEIDGTSIHFIHVKSPQPHAAGQPRPAVKLPVGFTTFPGEIFRTPRTWAEKSYPSLTYFNEVDKGGHFAAWEEPELFATEIRAAFSPLR